MNNNINFIKEELDWLKELIIIRLKLYFNQEVECQSINEITPPEIENNICAYSQFLFKNNLSFAERVCLILSLIPTLKPNMLDLLNIKNSNTGQRFVEFGCIEINDSNVLMPTFETLLFILSGDSVGDKIFYTNVLNNSLLFSQKIIKLTNIYDHTPLHFSIIIPSIGIIEKLINEKHYSQNFSSSFPATKLTTLCSWDDLVLDEYTKKQVEEIMIWVKQGDKILEEWELKTKIKHGYRALFHGPSGTGKTFTATLLGKCTERDVYCIDLSLIVSKYIGETEKNIENIFQKAENKNWILFFDEADALFGKRTNVRDSNDRYANQEISYLLQRVENYNGLILLSTNYKKNLDEAFYRRFQNVIYFPLPSVENRILLWQNTFSPKTKLDPKINLHEISHKYELTGGAILNIVQYCSMMAMEKNTNIISPEDLLQGIYREFQKEGKTI